MKLFSLFIPALLFATLSPTLIAGDVEIKWDHPNKFTDIQPDSSSTRKKYQQHVFKVLGTHLEKLGADGLPQGYHLKITVKNVDLAGYIDFGNGNLQRIVRDVDFPRIKLTFQLVKDHKLVKEGKANLKDMSFLHRVNKINNNEAFYYEKRLLSEWFKKSIVPLAQ